MPNLACRGTHLPTRCYTAATPLLPLPNRRARTARGWTFALLTAACILGLDNTGAGFLMGMAAVAAVWAYERAVRLVRHVVDRGGYGSRGGR